VILRKLGDSLELNVQLWDGALSQPKRVLVDLKKIDGTLITPRFEILHKGDGLYAENTKAMPSDSIVLAAFYVFEADGVTRSTIHAVAQEAYVRDITGEIIATNLDIPISSIESSKSDLVGTIEANTATGVIEIPEIIGTIEGDTPIIGEAE